MTRYRTIVADPPWAYNEGWPAVSSSSKAHFDRNRSSGGDARRALPYASMSVEAIKGLPVSDLAAPDAHLLLWTTNRYLRDAYSVVEAWGFQPSQLLTWCKPPMGLGPGGVFSNTSEFLVYGRCGKPSHQRRVDSTWWSWPRTRGPSVRLGEVRSGGHSAKPEAFLDMIEQHLPGPYLEMFARRARFGWDYWGDESLGTATLEGEAA